MKIAIVHDELVRRGGAEQVTLLMHRAFPEAPIYTSCYNPQNTYAEFENCDIKVSKLSRFAKDEDRLKKLFYPFGIWAMRNINLKQYDVVFISTTTGAKFVTTSSKSLFIAFCHYPFRLAWFPEQYEQVTKSEGLKKLLYRIVVSRLKRLDYKAASKIDWFITNTPHIKSLIENCYNPQNPIAVIPASIPCSNFHVEPNPTEDYYLLISRIESYKKVDIVIDAFNKMPNKRVIIVGKGSQKKDFIKVANSNIEFREGLSKEEIAQLYSNCKAFIFPQQEDYGLTPIEANASGRPVIAYGKGGVTYTTISYTTDSKKATAVYFEEQTSECLMKAIKLSETLDFDPNFIRKHAEQFDEQHFINSIQNFIKEKFSSKPKQ